MPLRTLNAAGITALGLLLMSCASSYRMYAGRALPNNAVAVLVQSGGGPAVVVSVDGKPYDGGLTYAGIGQNRWELLPGVHRVVVDLKSGGLLASDIHTTGPQTVTFTAEAGEVYEVSYKDKFLGRSGFFSEAFNWEPAIWPRHPVTDADRIKKKG